MDRWLGAALEYIPSWLSYQVEHGQQPGALAAVVQRGKVVLECAAGQADTGSGERLTPRHRFRIASHSKTFTAAGILKLHEQGKLRLDDPVGRFVPGLHRKTAQVTVRQVLSHSAGLVRDGADSGAFDGRHPFPGTDELRAEFAAAPIIDAGVRLKYSNRGYALLGMLIEAIAGESYAKWMSREIVAAAGLRATTTDMPLPRGTPFVRGHTMHLPLGRRVPIRGDYRMAAVAPAGGFVATASDTALFFNQLSPKTRQSILSPASRREMTHRLWRNPGSVVEGYYGLGTMSGTSAGWSWFGHGGSLPGYVSRTLTVPDLDLTVTVCANASDGWAHPWMEGLLSIFRTFATNGPPSRRVAGWRGRWWTMYGGLDLVPMGNKIVVGSPYAWLPFADTTEFDLTGRDKGRIIAATGYGSYGEGVRRVRDKAGRVVEVWLGATRTVGRGRAVGEMKRRLERKRRS
ncbi:MAG: beta-lactamase family protein [Enhydrobacter sp.]|nr:MAG: beta-lactamase family protein [Enhydrobacter sp.]